MNLNTRYVKSVEADKKLAKKFFKKEPFIIDVSKDDGDKIYFITGRTLPHFNYFELSTNSDGDIQFIDLYLGYIHRITLDPDEFPENSIYYSTLKKIIKKKIKSYDNLDDILNYDDREEDVNFIRKLPKSFLILVILLSLSLLLWFIA